MSNDDTKKTLNAPATDDGFVPRGTTATDALLDNWEAYENDEAFARGACIWQRQADRRHPDRLARALKAETEVPAHCFVKISISFRKRWMSSRISRAGISRRPWTRGSSASRNSDWGP